MNNATTLNESASLLLGAGLVQIGTNVQLGLLLVGVGAVLKIAIAILDKNGIVVSSNTAG